MEELEEQTLAIVNGGLTERLDGRDLSYEISFPGGARGSSSKIDRARRKALKSHFQARQRPWEPWTPKDSHST